MVDLVSILFRELPNIDILNLAQEVKLPKFSKINSGYIMEDVIRNYIRNISEIKKEFEFNLNLENFVSSNSGGFQLQSRKSKNCIYEIDDILTNDNKNLNLIEIKSGKISDKYFNCKLRKKSDSKTDISSIINSTKNYGYIPKLFVIYDDREAKVLKKSIMKTEIKHPASVTFLSYSNNCESEIFELVNEHNFKIDEMRKNTMKKLNMDLQY